VMDPSSVDTTTGFTYAWSVTKNGVAYTLPVGTVTNAANFTFTPNDNGTYVVTLAATDKDSGTGSTSRTINVTNVVPTAFITGPTEGVPGQARPFTLSASDPSSVDQASNFTFF